MDNIHFYYTFNYATYMNKTNKHTDNSQGIECHYLAKMIKGSAKIVTIDKQELLLNEGDWFYLPKNLKYHSYWTCADGQVSWHSVKFQVIPQANNKVYCMQKLTLNDAQSALFDKLCTQVVDCEWVGNLYLLLGSILSQMKIAKQDEKVELLEKIYAFVSENEDFKVKDLAKECMMSESGVYAFMKKNARISPIELKNKIKVQKAIELLQQTSLSVEEISTTLGFGTSAYFRKIVKKHSEKTPMQIRKEAKVM